jgi:hypothetical protein
MTKPVPKSWQELGDEFHMMIGYCIGEWAQVDDELFRIFRDCVGAYEQSAIIYYRMPGLDVRLGCTDELIESIFPKPERKSGGHPHEHVKKWREIKKTFNDLLAIRRRIAHHPIEIHTYGDRRTPLKSVNKDALSKYPSNAESWFALYVSQHEELRVGKSVPALSMKDLKEHLKGVVHLRDALRHFFLNELMSTKPQSKQLPPSPLQSPETTKDRG